MSDLLSLEQKLALRIKIVTEAKGLLGIPYYFGAEWTDYTKPPASLDCSELVEGCYLINGLRIPDGGQAQFDFTIPTATPQIGDLVFFGKNAQSSKIYHVGIVSDELFVIEARGYQPESAFETGKVILRPRSVWEKYSNFVGYRSHPKLA